MKIKNPPELLNAKQLMKVIDKSGDHILKYFEFMKPVDEQGRYLHWDSLRHRIPKELHSEAVWSMVKNARNSGSRSLPFKDTAGKLAKLYVTDFMQKICSQVDRLTSSAAENELLQGLDGRSYYIKELIGEESISSSQLEGAATTTRVAQEMLQIQRAPRNVGERMIMGNYRMMQFVLENAQQKLTPSLIKEIQSVGVSNIDDENYKPGIFRDHNNVVVEDTTTGEIVHQPPCHTELDEYINSLCDWANEPHEQNVTGSYIHPLLKACILHFMIGYIHPFLDGNGRTARALFYWYMLKCGYTAFRYVSISKLLKEAPVAYVKSYIYTETDDFDLTYFVTHQCEIVSRAVEGYVKHIKDLLKTKYELEEWLWGNNLVNELNSRQKQIMSVAISNPGKIFSISEAMENLNISYNTARTDLQKLAKLGFMRGHKEGRETLFIAPKNLIQAKKWNDLKGDLPKTTAW